MAKTKVSSKYQIVIPKAARKQLRIEPGMEMMIEVVDDKYAILHRKPSNVVEALAGLGKEVWKSLGGGEKYIKHERATWGDK